MNPAIAIQPTPVRLGPRRISDLLSSGLEAGVKSKKKAMDDVDASIQNDKEFLEATASTSPVREADLSELQKRLNEAMMKLSDEHRAVVTMFHIQGMPHAEISKILNVSEGTVRSRLFYANRQLQNYLDEFRKNPVT